MKCLYLVTRSLDPARAALRDALRRVALPQRPLDKPMLVINGEHDAQVLPDWVRSAVSRSCALGGRIEYLQIPNAGHNDLIWKVAHTVQDWIADRFAGTPPPSNCPAAQNNANGPSISWRRCAGDCQDHATAWSAAPEP